MNLVLITPVTLELRGEPSKGFRHDSGVLLYEPSLGVLTLSAVLHNARVNATVFDLNGYVCDLYLQNRLQDTSDVCQIVAPELAQLNADVFGFGTICSSYPLTVRIAREVKRLRPEVKIVFGGPQASVVDTETLAAFPFVDATIRGEADETIVSALDEIWSGRRVNVPGVTYRCGAEIIRNPNAPPVRDLDLLPPPAFELSRSIECCSYLPIEAGRGCPFSCTFCSTNDFFRRRFRLRSPARVLEEMDRLHAAYGVTRFDLVHDMFTVDRARVEAFCGAFLDHGARYTWMCSARSDCVDQRLLELMASAGCRALFFGIETGSPRMQKIVDKGLDLEEAAANIRCAFRNKIDCTAAFIVGFPEETVEDVAATAAFALDAARLESVSVQVGLLAPLAATPLSTQYRDKLSFDGIYSDMSHQAWEQVPADCSLIQEYPDIFSNFYGLPCKADRQYVAEFRHFLMYGLNRVRWLMVALGDSGMPATHVFDRWIAWRGPARCRSRYYGSLQFILDLCRFIRETFLPELQSEAISMMVEYYDALHELAVQSLDGDRVEETKPGGSHFPVRSATLRVIEFPFSPTAVIDALRSHAPIPPRGHEKSTVVVDLGERGRLLPSELPALGAAVLERCDGQTSVAEMAQDIDVCVHGLTRQETIEEGLRLLRAQGLVQFLEPLAEPDYNHANRI